MTNNTVRDIRSALNGLREAAVQTIKTLLEPYGEMLKKAPEAAIGSPREIAFYDRESHLGELAKKVLHAGGFAAPLFDVQRWEQVFDQLVTDYRTGTYSLTTVSKWFEMLARVRGDFVSAIAAALAETGEYEKLEFGPGASVPRSGLKKDVLAPQDLVVDLGIGVAAIRKRIRNGNLGPWKRQGNRWMILRKDFQAWLAAEAVKIEAGTSAGDAEKRADVLRLLERRKRRRGGGGQGRSS